MQVTNLNANLNKQIDCAKERSGNVSSIGSLLAEFGDNTHANKTGKLRLEMPRNSICLLFLRCGALQKGWCDANAMLAERIHFILQLSELPLILLIVQFVKQRIKINMGLLISIKLQMHPIEKESSVVGRIARLIPPFLIESIHQFGKRFVEKGRFVLREQS